MKTRIGISYIELVFYRILAVPFLMLWLSLATGSLVALLPFIWFLRYWILSLIATSNVFLLPDQILIGKKNIHFDEIESVSILFASHNRLLRINTTSGFYYALLKRKLHFETFLMQKDYNSNVLELLFDRIKIPSSKVKHYRLF